MFMRRSALMGSHFKSAGADVTTLGIASQRAQRILKMERLIAAISLRRNNRSYQPPVTIFDGRALDKIASPLGQRQLQTCELSLLSMTSGNGGSIISMPVRRQTASPEQTS